MNTKLVTTITLISNMCEALSKPKVEDVSILAMHLGGCLQSRERHPRLLPPHGKAEGHLLHLM